MNGIYTKEELKQMASEPHIGSEDAVNARAAIDSLQDKGEYTIGDVACGLEGALAQREIRRVLRFSDTRARIYDPVG